MEDRNLDIKINIDNGRRAGAEDLKRVRRDADGLAKDLKQVKRAADDVDRSLEKASRGADFGRTGGGIERVLSSAVGGGSQELIGLAGDIGDVIEGLTKEPGGLKAALKGLASPAGLLSIGLGAAGIAMAAFTSILDKQRVSAQKAAEELAAAAQTEETYAQLLEKSGTEAIESAKKEQQSQFEVAAAAVEALDARRKELQLIVDGQRARGTFLTQEQADLDALNAEYEKHAAALYAVNNNVLILNEIMGGTAFEAKKAAEGFDKLSKFLAVGKSAAEKLGDVVTGTLETIGDMAQETADEAKEAFDKLQSDVQSAVDKLDADGTKLGDALRSTLADLNDDLVAAQQDAAADIMDAQADAAAASLEAEREHLREMSRAETSFRREQAAIRRAALMDEREAIESNNIDQLLEIRDGKKEQLRENRIAFKDAQAERQEDFEARKQAEADALANTIAGIIAQRDAEIASINARMVEEQKAYDAAIAEVNRLKEANIAQINAVIAANERKHTAEMTAIDTATRKWEAMAYYYNGQLTTTPPSFGNGLQGPPPSGGLIGVPPPPVDPFGIGDFFKNSGREDSLSTTPPASTPPVHVTFAEGSMVVGDLASKVDIFDAVKLLANLFAQARTGVKAA
jgi:hypothetical protein